MRTADLDEARFRSVSYESSVSEKSKQTSLGPDFLRAELLDGEQGEFSHPVLLACLCHDLKMYPLLE